MLIPAGSRPSAGTSLGNHEERVRALERQRNQVGLPYAYLRTVAFVTIPADISDHYIDMYEDGSHVFDLWDTSDEEIFANGASSAFTGSPVHGVQVLAPGMYKWEFDCQFVAAGTPGETVVAYWSIDAGTNPSTWQWGRTAAAADDSWDAGANGPHISWANLHSLQDGEQPATGGVYNSITGGTDIEVAWSIWVTQQNPRPTALSIL